MNKHIKQLADKALEDIPDHVDFDIPEGFIPKLIELVVLESVAEAKDDCAGWSERDQCLVMQVMDRIKQHFGVEE